MDSLWRGWQRRRAYPSLSAVTRRRRWQRSSPSIPTGTSSRAARVKKPCANWSGAARSKAFAVMIVKARLRDILGALLLLVALPPFVYYIWLCVHDFDGALVLPASLQELSELLARIPGPTVTAVILY